MKNRLLKRYILGMALGLFPLTEGIAKEKKPAKIDPSEAHENRRDTVNQRRYHFMQKRLKALGVDEERAKQVQAIQKQYSEIKRDMNKRSQLARKKLERLERNKAAEAEIEAAIDEVATIQAEMMREIIRNRRKMEKVLGKKTYNELMESARKQYKEKRKSHRGTGMPLRPQIEGKENSKNKEKV